MPLANDPIMYRRSIWLFGHLQCQNPSIISESIGIPNGSKKMGKKSEEEEEEHGTRNTEESYSYRRGLCTFLFVISLLWSNIFVKLSGDLTLPSYVWRESLYILPC